MNYTPTKGHSFWLPTEIWVMVFQYLDLRDMKQFRLANHECRDIATPFCFEAVAFDISQASIGNLVNVASTEYLAKHPRALILRRRSRM